MALGFTPAIEIYGANKALINQRLISWEHIDAAGIESDQLTLVLDLEGLEGLPSMGGKIGLNVGYLESGLVDKGRFVVARRTPTLFPFHVTLVATAAPFSAADETGFLLRRSASHGPTTVGALFRELTSRHGFSPRVDPALALIKVDHMDQSNESDMSFITRLATKYNAITKPVNELYVLAKPGQANSLSGKVLADVRLSVTSNNRPGDHAFVTATLDDTARDKSQGCKVSWWDATAGKMREVEVGKAPFKVVRQGCQSEQEARAVGEGEVRNMGRQKLKVKISCPGNPDFSAEGIVLLDDTWPAFMRGRWSIDKVTSSGDRTNSYRCMIEATCLDPNVVAFD